MTRWNIACIFFMGVSGQRRDVVLKPASVNIITGASGTGKSALIKAIDYCLGSGKCELPIHVRRRSTAVGVKWIAGEKEMILGRLIPPDGQATSTHMFAIGGRNLSLPTTVDEFDGATTLGAAKAFIERAFGIGDLLDDGDEASSSRKAATVRHVTPYLFVTKEVIYSESVLLHGLEQVDKARDLIASMPYFLRATDEVSAMAERRLRQLRRVLEREEARARAIATADSRLKQRSISLLTEANRIGLAPPPSTESSESELLAALKAVSGTLLTSNTYPSESELVVLQIRRREVLARLADARRRSQATRSAIAEASGFEGAVKRQRSKLLLADHLHLQASDGVCPLCATPSEVGRETVRALQNTLATIRAESAAVERVKPKLIDYDNVVSEELSLLNAELRQIDDDIQTWLRQSDDTRRLADLSQTRAHLLGRISYFLESTVDEARKPGRDLSVLRDEIANLESQVDREAREIRLRRAEAKVSQFASEIFAVLPTVAPCIGSELDFSSRQPEVTVIEANTDAVLRMPDVGSDQNYLAIHLALSFALQRYFELVDAPVPGILVLDQISRPYFPARGEDEDEKEITGDAEDEDIQAMRRHVAFLFAEVGRRAGLQVLLIEHAYFADDPQFVAATRERWTRASGRALIPLDWPLRRD